MTIEAGSIGPALLASASALLAGLMALALVRLAAAVFGAVAPRDAVAVPILHVMGLAGGLALGIALLAATPDAASFHPGEVFRRDGPWMLDLRDFLARSVPGPATLHNLAAVLLGGGWLGCALAWVAALSLAGGAAIALLGWRGPARLRALLAVFTLSAWTALLIHYGAHLLAWIAAQLNFWTLAVLLLLFQHWRYGKRAAH